MTDADTYRRATELIDKASRILITTHTKPDGDACGCVAAMTDVLRSKGKEVQPLFITAVPQWYAFLFEMMPPVLGTDFSAEQLVEGVIGAFDLLVLVDTNSYSQLPRFETYLKQTGTPVLVIDHHVTSDGLGQVEIVDATAAATGLVLYDFLASVGWPVTGKMAEALFVAIATDTGWFQFNNTDSRVYRCCADLIDMGVSPTVVYDKLYQNFSYPRFKLMQAMLSRLELHLDEQYAVQTIEQDDFAQTGATYMDTENLINECHRIGSVKVSALLVALKDGRIRCSLRSRGAVDVSEIAVKFGGGGHKMAAGAFLPGPMDDAKALILDEVAQRLQ